MDMRDPAGRRGRMESNGEDDLSGPFYVLLIARALVWRNPRVDNSLHGALNKHWPSNREASNLHWLYTSKRWHVLRTVPPPCAKQTHTQGAVQVTRSNMHKNLPSQ